MRLRGKLTVEEIRDAGNLLRPKTYWPKLLLKNWYGLVVLGALIWATAVAFLDPGSHAHLRNIGIIWVVVGSIFAWAFYGSARARKRDYARLNLNMPDWITLESDGVRFDHATGEYSFYPWSLYEGWRGGEKVFLLDLGGERGSHFLPIGDLHGAQKSTLSGLLESYLKFPR